jgi:repressor of nif and glnA expression
VEEYKKMIKTIFQESNETYGVDRICGELRKRGKTALTP